MSFLIAPTHGAEPRKLIVILIDGLDARYLKDADRLHLKIPVLRKLMKQGVVADGVSGVIPGDTASAAATIASGVPPVVGAKAPTLWQAAAEAHRKTALLYWPDTVGAAADFVCPEFWEGRPTVDPPFDPIAEKCTPGLPQHIAAAYPTFTKAQWSDASALQALGYLVRFDHPDLTLVHLADLGGEELETGPLSLYSRDVLENDDELIGQAIDKRLPSTLVAVVADHGFETENYVVHPKLIPGASAVEVKYGLIGALDAPSAAALRKAIGNKKTGIGREVSLAEVKRIAPGIGGWTAAFVTMPGYIASGGTRGKVVDPGSHRGVYNEWPLRPNLRSAFVLSGPGVKPGKLGEISILSIAPTFADVIGVQLPAAKGTSLWPAIRQP